MYDFDITKTAAGTVAHGYIDLTKEVSKGVSGDSLKTLLANGNAYVISATTARTSHVPPPSTKNPPTAIT